jgi:DNA-binding transcriptional LysR family regulator
MLYPYCISYLQQMDSLFENFTEYVKTQNINIVDIAANHVGISYILPKYIKSFKNSNPDTRLKIRNLSKNDCIKRLLNDEIDMFIYPMRTDEIPNEFEFFPIVKYQPILLINKNHPLAKKKRVTMPDIAKFELVRIDPNLITLPSFEEIIKAHNVKTLIEFEMSDWEILKKFVKADIGVAVVSNIVLEDEVDPNLVSKPLTDYFPEMVYGILVKKGKIQSKLVLDFLNLITTSKFLRAQLR